MTQLATAPAPQPLREPGEESAASRTIAAATRWAGALAAAVAVFSLVLFSKGADPVTVLSDAVVQTFQGASLSQVLIKTAPLALAALAVVVPARAGMLNVGGEGQIIIGAVAAAGVGLVTDQRLAGWLVLLLMVVAGTLAGALWAGLAAVLRLLVHVNEAVSTLLLNYVALDLMLFLIYQPWKDPDGSGQPATRPLADAARLPVFTGTRVHVGLAVAVIAAVAVFVVLRWTSWGFKVAVTGGNPEAARRAGLRVPLLLASAMLAGGGLAGLAGVVHFAGVEYQLRPGMTAGLGYTAFLASWLALHRPVPVLLAAFVLAVFTVAGDSLQIDAGLPAATVNVLTGLVLVAVLGWAGVRKAAS